MVCIGLLLLIKEIFIEQSTYVVCVCTFMYVFRYNHDKNVSQ